MRIVFLLAAVTAALALSPSASAAVAPGAGLDASVSPDECAGPCPSVLVFKGRGAGSVTSQPDHVACTSPFLCTFEPDNLVHGPTLTLRARPATNSYLAQWQCPSVGGHVNAQNECVLDLNIQGATYTVCVVFEVQDTPPAPPTSCPPPTALPPPAPPPPPPPSNPPRVGSRCTIPGTAGPNVINGTPGRDVICGRGGNDRINGRGGHDLILGGSGRDRLTGGSGRDAIYGNSGNDTLLARDGARDTVNGGRGRDRARWDARDVRRSIERRL